MLFKNVITVLVLLAAVEAHYYYKPKKTDATCNAVADVIFVYDTSGSIGTPTNQANFDAMKEFMINIVNEFDPVGATGTQFAALCFSVVPKPHFYLNDNNNDADPKQATKDDIQAFSTAPNSRTAIGDALKELSTSFLTPAKGIGRNCAQCFVIVITDGEQNEGTADPVEEANKLRQDKDCIVYVVSIGQANSVQLENIAGGQANVFSVDKFNELNNLVKGLVQAACSNSACVAFPDKNGGHGNHHNGGNRILIPVPMPIMIPADYPVNRNQKNDLKDLISLIKGTKYGYGYGNKFKPSV
ncbi:collagen alpha-6(VI) chain-like [Mytilus edulis]|uniref:collagen alpha-6(VI) chain-like n=1 Tax=Mytilus edulis TaxID=6550 RepID=UPI0039F0FC76